MKMIKAITDYGIQEVQIIGKPKEIKGQLWVVAKVPRKYMNAKEPLIMQEVIHYATGANLPIRNINYNATAKSMLEAAEAWLTNMGITNEIAAKEVKQYEILNK